MFRYSNTSTICFFTIVVALNIVLDMYLQTVTLCTSLDWY